MPRSPRPPRPPSAMHRAFHLERQYVATNLCPCNGCTQADNLKLKFVAHIGEVATQTIRQRRKLVGIDVILVHRLLKNPVQVARVPPVLRGALPDRRSRSARSRARGLAGPRGNRARSRVLRGLRGPRGLSPSAAGSLLARTPREDGWRRRPRPAVHAGPAPPAAHRFRSLILRRHRRVATATNRALGSARGGGGRKPRHVGLESGRHEVFARGRGGRISGHGGQVRAAP